MESSTHVRRLTVAGALAAVGLGLLMLAAPAQTQLPPGMKPFETTKVAEGVYSFRYFFHRNIFIVTRDGVIATDPLNPNAAATLAREIRKITDKPVKYVVYSHQHLDHASGGAIFKKQGATFISHERCLPAFQQAGDSAVVPDITFAKRYDLTLGGATLELRYHGLNHGDCLITMRLPRERLLFVVDIVSVRRVGFRGLRGFYPKEWIQTLKELETIDVDRIIPGHGPPTAPKSVITEQRLYLEDLRDAVLAAKAKGMTPGQMRETIKLPKYESWGRSKEWLPLNIDRFAEEVEKGW